MKTKKVCRQRKQEREFEVAKTDFTAEFEESLDESMLDEEAFCMALAEDEE